MRRTMPFLLAALLSLVVVAPARADLFTDVLKDYVADSRLDACTYTQGQLKQLKDLVPVDQNAYSADFVAALDDAIARRAEGACNKRKQAQALTPPPLKGPPPSGPIPSAQTPQPATAPPATQNVAEAPPTPGEQPAPAPETVSAAPISVVATETDPATDAPFPVLALAILLGILALGGLLVGSMRWMGWEPAWASRMRHAAAEAGWRASCTWAEFTDFVRFGR
ncbi:MAG TPA: hypothetical protein VF526_00195 [Solirubrobacteraceae bacterium]